MSKDYFKNKADSYDQDSNKHNNIDNIANLICDTIKFDSKMNILDFGSGTGLLLERIAPYVNMITAVDVSKSMNEQLHKKKESIGCKLEMIEMDLAKSNLDKKFDGIISSMTMHHVEDVKSIFDKFYALLNDGGFIAIADLDIEDGSFHSEDTGVHHLGFDREELLDVMSQTSFANVQIQTASTLRKPQGDYSLFLLTAYK